MARVIRGYTQSGEDDWYNAAMNGINNGIGIANAIHARDAYKAQMEQYQRETAEWEDDKPRREAQRQFDIASLENQYQEELLRSSDIYEKQQLVVGTSLANAGRWSSENWQNLDPQEFNNQLGRILKGSTAGQVEDYTAQPVRLEDGSTAWNGLVKLKGGETEWFQFRDGADLERQINALRHKRNLYTINEKVHARLLNGEAKLFWDQMDADARKRYGVSNFEDAKKNKDFMAHATDALANKLTGGSHAQILKERDQGDELHRLAVSEKQMALNEFKSGEGERKILQQMELDSRRLGLNMKELESAETAAKYIKNGFTYFQTAPIYDPMEPGTIIGYEPLPIEKQKALLAAIQVAKMKDPSIPWPTRLVEGTREVIEVQEKMEAEARAKESKLGTPEEGGKLWEKLTGQGHNKYGVGGAGW